MYTEPITVVIGASPNPNRYANKAVVQLTQNRHTTIPLGIRSGIIAGVEILTEWPSLQEVDTVTLYIGPARQPEHYNYIRGLKPKRVIFNPGTENPEFATLLEEDGVEVVPACTLVMLATGQY